MPPLRKGGAWFPPFHFAEGVDGVFFHIDVGSIKVARSVPMGNSYGLNTWSELVDESPRFFFIYM